MISFNRTTICLLFIHLSFDVAWSLGLIFARGQVVSCLVVQAKKWGLHKNPQKWDKKYTAHTVVTHFKVKLIHRLKTQVGREVEKKCLSRETSVNSPTTSHSPSSGMSAPSTPHNPTATGARNKCSSSWYRRISLDNATNYQIGKAKQNAKEVWAHRKPLLGNLINCYLARTVPVPRNIEIEHCSHLLSYLFVHVFSCFVFLFLQQCMASTLPVHLRDETMTRMSFHFTFRRGGGGEGGCHVTVAL